MNRSWLVGLVLWCGFVGACAEPPEVEAVAAVQDDEPFAATSSVKREAIVVPQGPDLRAVSVSAAFTAAARNTSKPVAVTVCNNGSSAAPAASVSVLVSSNTTVDGSDVTVGTAMLPALAPAACQTLSVSSTFSPAVGTYYLGLWVDRADAINEEIETNNILLGGTVYIGNRPDVTVSVLSAPVSAPANTSFTTQLRACNTGSATAASVSISLRRSTDTTINSSDTSMGVTNVGSIAAGACTNVNASGSSTAFTERYLGAWVSTSSTEVTTTNNGALAGRFAVGNNADLVIEALSHQLIGGTLQTTATVCNRGYVNAAASTLSTHLSIDATYDASDTQLGTIAIPLLAANTCTTVTQTHALPALTATRIPLARVDATSVITELFESNNVNAGSSLTLGPDLHVTAFNVVHDGSVFVADAVVCNDGTVNNTASVLGVLQSIDQLADASDPLVSSIATPAVAAGACVSVSGNFSVLSAPGQFTFIARADEHNVVSEVNETNNTRYAPPTGISADLVVTSNTAWMSSEQLGWNVRVCNNGNLAASNVETELQLSNEVVFATTLSQLVPGACVDLTGSAQVTARGTQQLVAGVDTTDMTPETNEANNTLASAALFIGTHFTLGDTATAVSWNGSANVFTVTGTLCNAGSLSGATSVDAALSYDTARDWSDVNLTVGAPPTNAQYLAPAACVAVTLPYTGSGVADGTFYALISTPADDGHAGELAVTGPFTLRNDLSVSNATVAVSWNGSENHFTVSAQVCNVGTRPSSSTSFGRLSTDSGGMWPNYSLMPVSQPTMSMIQPGTCEQLTTVLRWYGGPIPDGTYFVFFEQNASADSNPANNVAMAPMPVTLRNDLVVSNATASVAWTGSEHHFTLSAQVCNVGTRPSSSVSFGRLTTTPSSPWPSYTLQPVGQPTMSMIQPGTCEQLTVVTHAYGAPVPSGTYFVFFEQNVLADGDPSNNVALAANTITF